MLKLAGQSAVAGIFAAQLAFGIVAQAQERLPWESSPPSRAQDPYAPQTRNRVEPSQRTYSSEPPARYTQPLPRYTKPQRRYAGPAPTYQPKPYSPALRYDRNGRRIDDDRGYQSDRRYRGGSSYDQRGAASYDRARPPEDERRSYSQSEIISTGHRFFGKLSSGLAKAIEYVFRSQGRPTGYILGEGAGGAFIAGLRYGEGYLHTKYGDRRKVYWQGPSVGYDFGGEGSRTMVLVYNLNYPNELYRRYAGVQGSAYVVGGAGVQFLKNGNVTLAPIRTGLGLRLGANIGYLKFTRRPTWNPF